MGDIAVARFLLADVATLGSALPAAGSPALVPRSASARALPWVSSAAALAFAIAWLSLWAPWRQEAPVDRPLVRLDVDLGADVTLPTTTGDGNSINILALREIVWVDVKG